MAPLIERLELIDFRNVAHRVLEFSGPGAVFCGPNGTGKTNLLESIYLLSILRSFRSAGPKELVRLGTERFELKLTLNAGTAREEIILAENLAGARQLMIGKQRIRRASDFIGEFRAVAFTPEDRMLVSGGASFRRRFFDVLISPLDPAYLGALSNYAAALEQRNKALKSCVPAVAAAFEPELAAAAPVISKARKEFSAKVEAEVNRLFAGKREFCINYHGDAEKTGEARLREFALSRPKEQLRGATLSGPQLDEFEFLLDGKPLRGFGSTGQIRIASLLLKLAAFQLVRQRSASRVVVLADDVTGELDRSNVELFLQTTAAADQRFFTFVEVPPWPELSELATINSVC